MAMNPIKITLSTLGIWIILTFVYALNFVEDVSEKPFEFIIYSFYLMPFVCILAFVISLFFYRSWINRHRVLLLISSLFLIAWALGIILCIKGMHLV